jgi:hypothetical protein
MIFKCEIHQVLGLWVSCAIINGLHKAILLRCGVIRVVGAII